MAKGYYTGTQGSLGLFRTTTRGLLETGVTLPYRMLRTSRLDDMSPEEKDYAYLSDEMYKEPADRDTELRGGSYTLLQGEIPADGHLPAVPLNDTHWAVFRAFNQVDHVLAFRGTEISDKQDLQDDAELAAWGLRGRGAIAACADPTLWSFRVMKFLASPQSSSTAKRLKFSVTGHSLGGAVAMEVLHKLDSPCAARVVEDGTTTSELGFWKALKVLVPRAWTEPPYDLRGGHIFNPGSSPALFQDLITVSAALFAVASAGATVATAAVCHGVSASINGGMRVADVCAQMHGGDDRFDKHVTTHHILGDVISCWFRIGKEKRYWKKKGVGYHTINNFLD